MIDPLRATALALASTTLMAVTPQETYSAQQLALLDPTVRMASLCTGKGGPQSMRARQPRGVHRFRLAHQSARHLQCAWNLLCQPAR